MQPDSLCRISLQTHDHTNTCAKLYAEIHDDKSNIHLTLGRHENKKYNISIMRQHATNPNQYTPIFGHYSPLTDEEQTHFDPFFESTPLPLLEQHITTLLTQWIKPSSIERINILLHFMQRVPHYRLQYEDQTNRLYYYNDRAQKHIYWNSMHEIHQWCDIPPFHYYPDSKKWIKRNIPRIVPYLLTNRKWSRLHTPSMHETINIMRRANALGIPSLPQDIPATN